MQIVGYDTVPVGDSPWAQLLVSESDGIQSVPLEPGATLDYSLGSRHCAGTITENTHDACAVEDSPYCDRHTTRWACARCTGSCDLPLSSCHDEHAVYLAAFAPDTFKVGVTRSWRLETRLREQGADRGAHIRTVSDGRIARQIEAEIASEIGDRVRVPAKIRGLHLPVDETAWEDLLAEYDPIDTISFDYDLDLSERPVAETLATGTVRGVQGRILLLDTGGTTYAVDLRDLVGCELTAGGTDRALQSSFAAFETSAGTQSEH